MTRSWWAKFVLLIFFVVLSAIYVYPTVANLDPQTTKFPFKQKINLGLDLQGGLYLVLGVDFHKVYKEVVERQGTSLRGIAKDKGIEITKLETLIPSPEDPHLGIDFDPGKQAQVRELIHGDYWRVVGDQPGHFELGLTTVFRNDIRERTINQSIEVIRNRIDEFGVSEPVIASQGTDRLVVELPGVRDIERAKSLIGQTAKLEFKMVDDQSLSPSALVALVADLEKKNGAAYKEGEKFSEFIRRMNDLAKGKIPAGDEIAFERRKSLNPNRAGEMGEGVPYLLHSKVEVTGGELQDAMVQIDQENRRPNVGFTFNPRGAVLFGKLTEENIHKRLAIVLDGIVKSAPVIQARISEHGQITLGQGGGDELMRDAKDLAIVLRAGALPAQLEPLEQRVVGPSLGADSIRSGARASLVGSLIVFAFVILVYRISGAIAVVSLLLNVLFVLAILVGLEATLTLPGIAGIALTVGIAVDSNVVVYERIREEIRAGKRAHGAVSAGFQKAFRTILDANVTNAAAAVVLLMYGTGPIKGFAVTLLIGIVTTLFTAVFVCQLLFDAYLKRMDDVGAQTISI